MITMNLSLNKKYIVQFIHNNKPNIENNFEKFADLVNNSELSHEDAIFISDELNKAGLEVFSELFDRKYFGEKEEQGLTR